MRFRQLLEGKKKLTRKNGRINEKLLSGFDGLILRHLREKRLCCREFDRERSEFDKRYDLLQYERRFQSKRSRNRQVSYFRLITFF